MIRFDLASRISGALAQLVADGSLPDVDFGVPEVADTKDESHGDYACNIAMVSAKRVGKNPRELATMIASVLALGPEFEAVEVAGPGFLNLRLKPEFVADYVGRILDSGEDLSKAAASSTQSPDASKPRRLNVEFVSVNPNGPITVGSGRGAAFGSTLCNVLAAAGKEVHREYYINDGVNSEQMRLFAESVISHMTGAPIPEGGYKGEYVALVAERIKAESDLRIAAVRNSMPGVEDQEFEKLQRSAITNVGQIQVCAMLEMIGSQRNDLATFGVQFDTWFSEQSLHDSGTVEKCIQDLQAKGVADEEPFRTLLKMARGGVIEEVVREEQAGEDEEEASADSHKVVIQSSSDSKDENQATTGRQPDVAATLWLRSTKFADDMDRVLRRKDGRLTYIASDVAYHKDKLLDESGVRKTGPVDKMITILGPDHHGYIHRLQAVLAALLEGSSGSSGSSDLSGRNPTPEPNRTNPSQSEPLSPIESQIYRSAEERDACQAALKEAREKLEVVIFQIVRFVKDGKPAPMRKRDGNIYALIDLINELGKNIAPTAPIEEQQRIGKDVARFFYLMRSHETHMDFDIDLATKQSEENPVFYAQYAHARICSILEKAREQGIGASRHQGAQTSGSSPEALMPQSPRAFLSHPKELALIKKICDLPFEVARCAEDYGVHRLTTFAVELARAFHHFYDACRVIEPDQPEQTQARLALCEATKIGLRGVFDLLGISAPEKMERAESQAVEPSKNS